MKLYLLITFFTFTIFFTYELDAQHLYLFKVQVTGKGKPMILIPGLACSGEVWKGTVEHYKNTNTCYVITLAGFAGIPPVDTVPFLKNVRDDLIRYIEKKNIKKPIIVGHSLGGFLALNIALSKPDLLSKIVIVDAVPFLPALYNPSTSAREMEVYAEDMQESMLEKSNEEYKKSQKTTFRALITDTIVADKCSVWGETSDPKTVAQAVSEMMTTDIRDDLGKITLPCLVMGTWIEYKSVATSDDVEYQFKAQYKKLKNCKISIYKTARHFIMLDDEKGFLNEIDTFLLNK